MGVTYVSIGDHTSSRGTIANFEQVKVEEESTGIQQHNEEDSYPAGNVIRVRGRK